MIYPQAQKQFRLMGQRLGFYEPFLFGVALAFLLVVVLDVVVALAFLLVVVLDVLVAFELDAEDLLVVVLVTSVVATLVPLGVPLDLLLAVPVEVAPAELLPDMLDDAADEVDLIEPIGGDLSESVAYGMPSVLVTVALERK